ncbi:cysteine-rich receptor-like protein kinase 25 [Quercus suber]|uniref:Cysteine-rich receptor-like protein kinase 25 n=2 Tax=Quercus suber TaxID=58331 RepID=A0AAW0J5E6_QUESU
MASFSPFCLPLIVILSMFCVLNFTAYASANSRSYVSHVCANTTFPQNSSYQSSLNSVLSSLSLYATRNFEFYSLSSLNSSLSSSDAINKIQVSVKIPIYSIYLCRGDVSAEECQECVAAASKEVANKCSNKMAAVIWYQECMIRYSNKPFYSTMDVEPAFTLPSTQNISEQQQLSFSSTVNATLITLASQASEGPADSKKFGTTQVNFSAFQTVYNLAQCTPDLTTADCNRCLQVAIKSFPSGRLEAGVFLPSCFVSYELYPFYRLIDSARALPPPPLSPPPGSAAGPKGKSQIPTVTILATVAPIAVSVVLFFHG